MPSFCSRSARIRRARDSATTPQRIAESYAEFFAGLDEDPVDHLRDAKEFADEKALGELVLLRDIEFRSMCEHHLLPFVGVAHVAYIPRDRDRRARQAAARRRDAELAARSCRNG